MTALKHGKRAKLLADEVARPLCGALALRTVDRLSHVSSIVRRLPPLKALTVHQLWAWAIAEGLKPYENRTWRTEYRGDVAIIAGLSRRSLAASGLVLHALGIRPPPAEDLVFGAIICLAELVEVLPVGEVADQPLAEGPWCWKFENIRRLARPLSCRGVLGLTDLPPAVRRRLVTMAR